MFNRVSPERLAQATERSLETVHAWRDGTRKPPPYLSLTITAIERQLAPVSDNRMYAHRLQDVLGVAQATEWQWRYEGKFPVAARLAVAAIEARVKPSLKRVVHNVNIAGSYYRARGGWKARPVMGRRPPDMKPHTPDAAVAAGYLTERDGKLTVTPKGRDLIYGK